MQRLTWAAVSACISSAGRRCGVWAVLMAASAGCAQPSAAPSAIPSLPNASSIVIESPPGTGRPPFTFSAEDDELLDEVEHGAFLFLWNACSPETGMVVDRSSVKFASIAGVGFQLAALPVGVERGWITRAEGQDRAEQI